MVLAKVYDLVPQQINKIAAENGIPIVENAPLMAQP